MSAAKQSIQPTRTTSVMRLWPLLVSVVLVMVSSTVCRATFMLPDPPLFSLAKSVTATCHPSGDCTPTMDEATCVSRKVCSLTCPTRTDFPETQVRFSPSLRPPSPVSSFCVSVCLTRPV